jgi:hypothetical protein
MLSPRNCIDDKKLAYVDLFRTCCVSEGTKELSYVRAGDKLGIRNFEFGFFSPPSLF